MTYWIDVRTFIPFSGKTRDVELDRHPSLNGPAKNELRVEVSASAPIFLGLRKKVTVRGFQFFILGQLSFEG